MSFMHPGTLRSAVLATTRSCPRRAARGVPVQRQEDLPGREAVREQQVGGVHANAVLPTPAIPPIA
jgi:hypothetical protein